MTDDTSKSDVLDPEMRALIAGRTSPASVRLDDQLRNAFSAAASSPPSSPLGNR